MKHRFEIQRKTALASVLIALVSGVSATAQTFTILKHFGEDPDDGRFPLARLTLSGSVLYGTTAQGGGSWGWGTVFKLNTDGTGYRVLKEFTSGDGEHPEGDLVLSGTVLHSPDGSGRDGRVRWNPWRDEPLHQCRLRTSAVLPAGRRPVTRRGSRPR